MKYLNSCKLLVAGAHYLSLYDQNKEEVLHNEGGVYYGISWAEDRLFVLWRNFKKGEIILIFDNAFQLIDQININKYLDGHQILYVKDQLFLTNTAENALIKINLKNRDIREIKLTPFDYDHNHINGLSYIEENYMWILYANGKIDEKSEIKKFDIDREEIVESLRVGSQVHNYLNGYITSSYDFQVFRYKEGQIANAVRLEGWLRGMDFVDDRLIVGSSVISEREKRSNKLDGNLYFLDRDLKVMDEIKIKEIGQINEIRTISKEFSHNSVIFKGAENNRL